jgi:hypothetical protein
MEQLLGRFPSDIVFIERLMAEESVMCLPGRVCLFNVLPADVQW